MALTLDEKKALRLIRAGGKGLTHLGNVIVSTHARSLLRLGVIDYAPERDVGYRVTEKGEEVLANE